MTLEIGTPNDISTALFKGRFEVVQENLQEKAKQRAEAVGEDTLKEVDTPELVLGMPESWEIPGKVAPQRLGSPRDVRARDEACHVVRLACSFLPTRSCSVDWARLVVSLRPYEGSEQPIALDIFPREVYEGGEREISVKITPSLKFASLEVSAGEALASVRLRSEPVIVGGGVQTDEVYWDFQARGRKGVQGVKFLYMLVRRPWGARGVVAEMDLVARLKGPFGLRNGRPAGLRSRLQSLICAR